MFESDIESFDTEFDTEFEEFDFSEASRRPRSPSRPLRTPPRGNAVVAQARQGYALKAELDATARRLDDRIATISGSVTTLDRRSHSLERETNALGGALRKEIVLRKKETAELKRNLDESRQIAMILPMLGGGTDNFSKMLPVLLYGGMLGNSGSGADSNTQMMTTMMMVLALRP